MRPTNESRSIASEDVRAVAMRSVREKREEGEVVDVRRLSRTCEPVGESARVITGFSWFVEVGGGKRSMLISFLRNGVFVAVGRSADCMICVVVW